MPVEVRPVASKRELKAFMRLPWRLYRNEPHWGPPLLMDLRKRLDRRRNPFFEHAEAEYFLAWRDGRPVGRITAQVDRNLNEFQGNDWGLFGFFECEDDSEAATALLAAAADWLRQRGRDRMVGPMDFTTNDECGLLVEGHDRMPIILTPWQYPYYQRLLEGAGLTKAMDTFMWELWVDKRERVHPTIWEMAERVESEHGIVVRPANNRDLRAEVERFLEVYNAAWEKNWGFVPLTDAEARHYPADLRPLPDEHCAMIAEKLDTAGTVGARFTLPAFNPSLARGPRRRQAFV